MSRDGRDDHRAPRSKDRLQARNGAGLDRRAALARDLRLPRGPAREPVRFRYREYQLSGSETELLATVGAFRVVMAEDPRGPADDQRHLADQGLISRTSVAQRQGTAQVLTLTPAGKGLLEASRDGGGAPAAQRYYAGLVKPRELAHDAQIYRAFQAEAGRIEREGGRITRVQLDYELKREYQQFLNRAERDGERSVHDDRLAFAVKYRLSIVDGHLELPDLRIEYERADGRLEHRDVELVTEHYSRAQLAGKTRAGFSRYRSRGAGVGRGTSRSGGTPVDPHNLDWLG